MNNNSILKTERTAASNSYSYVKHRKVIHNFWEGYMSVIFEYRIPFQRLVEKVGNNFLSAAGLDWKSYSNFFNNARNLDLFYFIGFLLKFLRLILLYVVHARRGHQHLFDCKNKNSCLLQNAASFYWTALAVLQSIFCYNWAF